MSNGLSKTGSVREALQWKKGTHPLDQASQYSPFPLYEWQYDVIAAGARPKSRAIMSTCNFSGKTSIVMPVFGMSVMNAFPGAQVLSTSGDAQQVKEQLFEQQLKPLIMQDRFQEAGWKIKTGDSCKVTAPNGSTWLGYVTARDSTFEGFHSYWRTDEATGQKRYCPLVFLVDESKSVGDGVHQAIRRIDPDFMIALSTPGPMNGWFYDGVHPESLKAKISGNDDHRGRAYDMRSHLERMTVDPVHDYLREYQDPNSPEIFTYRRQVNWDDCPHLQSEDNLIERQNQINRFGRNSAYIKSMLFGEFQRAEDDNLVYTDEDIELMRSAMKGRFEPIGMDMAAASDTSDGGDAQPFMVRIGTNVAISEKPEVGMQGDDHARHLAERLHELKINPWDFTIDGGGVGAIVANLMEKQFDCMGIKRAQANTGPRFKFEYRDKYTEAHFLLRELLAAKVLKIPWSDALLKQMQSRQFSPMVGGRIKMEDKPAHRKRHRSSPDELDTLVYLFYDFDWSLLATFAEVEIEKSEDALTPMEEEASRAISGKSTAFRGMRDVRPVRNIIAADPQLRKLRIGR